MKARSRHARASIAALLAASVLMSDAGAQLRADQDWLPLPYGSLQAQPGSALDLSNLVEPGPAGRHGRVRASATGHLEFSGLPGVDQRFNCSAATMTPTVGRFPDKARADLLAAELRRGGYNAIRLHFADAALMQARKDDFGVDPDQLDRMFYFLAALKREGIYWIADVLTSRNGYYGSVEPHRWAPKYRLQLSLYSDPASLQHWFGIASRIFTTKNPYTNQSILEDPATLALVLVNENSIDFLRYTVPPDELTRTFQAPFGAWLRQTYATREALAAAWRGELAADETFDTIAIPPIKAQTSRGRDFNRFASSLEADVVERMRAHLRSLGYDGLVTSYSTNTGFASSLSRRSLPLVDLHGYHDNPTGVDPGARILNTSSLSSGETYLEELAWGRLADKPFTVSELGHPFWNQWRYEFGLTAGAQSALQDWDAVCRYGEGLTVATHYPHDQRRKYLFPYQASYDPVSRATDKIISLLYGRRDVSADASPLTLRVSQAEALSARSAQQFSPSMRHLALIKGVRARILDDETAPATADLSKGELTFTQPPTVIADMKRLGILPQANTTNPGTGRYESASREIVTDIAQGAITVATPRTVGYAGPPGSARTLGPVTLSVARADASLVVSSLDGAALDASRRMLVIFATDALNTNMRFTGSDRREVASFGQFPILVRRGSFTLGLGRAAGRGPWRAYALGLDGARVEELPIERQGDDIRLSVDTGSLKNGPTTYMEIVSSPD